VLQAYIKNVLLGL